MTHKVMFSEESEDQGTVCSHHAILHLLSCLTQSWGRGDRVRVKTDGKEETKEGGHDQQVSLYYRV